jgi:gliding motility-associated-like protein
MGKFLLFVIILVVAINIANATGAFKINRPARASAIHSGARGIKKGADKSAAASFGAFTNEKTPDCTMQLTTNQLPTQPTITAGPVTGTAIGCSGVASASPNILQLTVSGSNLTGDITASVTAGFDISLSAGSGYATHLVISQSNGTVNTIIYARTSANAIAGGLTSSLTLSSPGAQNLNPSLSGKVYTSVQPSVFITASTNSVCAGAPVTFTTETTNGGAHPSYQWQVNGTNAGTNSATFTTSTLATGDVIQCILTSDAVCSIPAVITSNSIKMAVNTPAGSTVNIAASANNVCSGTPVTFTATPAAGSNALGYEWQVNGNNAGTDNNTFTSSTLGNGDVVSCVLIYSTACIPSATSTSNDITMNISPSTVVNAGGNKTISAGGSTLLNATATGDVADITWSPATGLSNNKILNPVASPATTTTYTLTVKTSDGCVSMDDATVEVLLPIVVPNSFTPNNDGINDTWNIKYLDVYSNCTVQIFNRWGQTVFSSIGYGTPWNGQFKGAVLPTGTYYYIIDLKQNSKLLSGYVAIIK